MAVICNEIVSAEYKPREFEPKNDVTLFDSALVDDATLGAQLADVYQCLVERDTLAQNHPPIPIPGHLP